MKPTLTTHTFCDFMDRIYELGNLHPCHESHTLPLQHGQFTKFQQGKMAHLLVHKDGVIYVRLVPIEGVRFLFDAYGV